MKYLLGFCLLLSATLSYGQHVGVGTTEPEDLLHVEEGNIRLETSGFHYLNIVATNISGMRFDNGTTLDGGVWYRPAAGLLNISDAALSNGLVVDFSTQSVGVQTSPLDPLHVKNALRIDGSAAALKFFSGAVDKGYLTHAGTELKLSNKFAGNLSLSTADLPRLTIDHTGETGIGTTDPLDLLHLAGGTLRIEDSSPGLKLYDGATAMASLTQLEDSLYITNQRKGSLFLGTDNSPRVAIDSVGNVGLGTNAPFAKLDVRGGIRVEDVNPMFRMHNDGMYSMYMQHYDDDLFLSNVHAGRMTFKTANTDRMTIDATGKVGIGTTTPSQPLHIEGNTRLAGQLQMYLGNDLAGYIYHTGAAMEFTNAQNNSMHFKINGLNRLAIQSDGKVGIGTSSPQDKLHLRGILRIDNIFPGIDFYDDTDNKAFIGYSGSNMDITAITPLTPLRLRTEGQTRMTIQPDGKVTIGTTEVASPERLHVDGGMRITSSGPGLTLYQGSTERASLSYSATVPGSGTHLTSKADLKFLTFNGQIRFFTSDQDFISQQRMVLDTFGNLGLGVAAPQAVVDIAGGNNWDLASSNGDFKLGGTVNHIKMGVALSGAGAGIGRIYASGTTDKLILGAGTTDVLAIEGSGEVGIGTNSPGHPLEMGSGAHVTAGGVWTNASDASLKYNITDLDYSLDILAQLHPVRYHYKADSSQSIGFIAQEIQEVIPEVVSGEDGSKGIAYGLLTSVLVKAVQQLDSENAVLRDQVRIQQQQIDALLQATQELRGVLTELQTALDQKTAVNTLSTSR